MFRYIAMTLLVLVTPFSYALEVNEWALDVNATSKHKSATYDDGKKKYNEDNLGFGISYGYRKNLDLTLGYYKNSYFKTSVYVGIALNKNYYINRAFVVSPSLGLFMVTGYNDTPMKKSAITPAAHPSISFGFKNLRSNIGLIPTENMVVTFQTKLVF